MLRSKTTVNLPDLSQTQQLLVERPTKNLHKMREHSTADTVDTVDTFRTTLTTAPPMKSVRFHGPGDIRVENIDEPICRRGEVKVCFLVVGQDKILTGIDSTSVCGDLWDGLVYTWFECR